MNSDNENNENLINQEPDFITFGDYPKEEPEETVQEPEYDLEVSELETEETVQEPEYDLEVSELETEETVQEPEYDLEVSELETGTTVDYSQDFLILENIGYFQVFFLGTLTIFFILWLVCKFFKSFF